MHKPSSLKSVIFVLIIVAAVLVGYFYYSGNSSSSTGSLLSSSSPDATSDAIGVQVLGLLNQIQSLRIDSTLFADPAYQTLRDYSVQIPPQNVGRANPFAPIPGAPAAPSTSH
jgi:hypothetical protein